MDGKINASVKNSRTSVKNSRSDGKIKTSVKKSRSNVKNSRSRIGKKYQTGKKDNRTARGKARSGSLVQANLEVFASIGLAKNEFVTQICQMDHVTPDDILGQRRRLQAERRYSHGLLLTVIRSKDYLEEKYLKEEEPEEKYFKPEEVV